MDRLKYIPFRRLLRKWPLISCFVMLALLSCGDEYIFDDVDCADCYTPKPDAGPVSITVTINSQNSKVPIKIFKGKYEERYRTNYDDAVVIDTVRGNKYSVDLDVNEYYSVEAEYNKDGSKVLVIDGDKLKVLKVSDQCEDVCWIYKGGNIDVTLKK